MASTEARQMVLAAAAVCEDKKAENTRVLELDPADSGFTDFFLITSGNNTRQTQAIADDIELRLKRDFNAYANSVEGRRNGEWILMDYVDFVVHIFLEEKRAFYDIERLRKSARPVDVEELKTALTEKVVEVRRKTAAQKTAPPMKRATPKKDAAAEAKSPRKTVPKRATASKKVATRKAPTQSTLEETGLESRQSASEPPARQRVDQGPPRH